MPSWPRRPTPNATEPLVAYREGRTDEHQRVETEGADDKGTRRRLEDEYQRGRREERLRRHRHPIGMLVLSVLAIIGLAAIVSPARYGSFSQAGAAADNVLASAQSRATAPVRGAEARAGDALQNAGGALKSKAGPGAS